MSVATEGRGGELNVIAKENDEQHQEGSGREFDSTEKPSLILQAPQDERRRD